jgi:hypothetical protein
LEGRHDQVAGPGSRTLDDRLGQLVDGQLGLLEDGRDCLDDQLGLLRRQHFTLDITIAAVRHRRECTGPQSQIACGQQMYCTTRPKRLNQAMLGPQGVLDPRAGDTGDTKADG